MTQALAIIYLTPVFYFAYLLWVNISQALLTF